MNTNPNTIYKPKKDISYYFILVVSIGCIVSSYFIFVDTFKYEYPQFGVILIGSLVGFFGLFAFYSCLNQKTIYVFDDFIELTAVLFFKKIKIQKSDIISWSEFDRSHKKDTRFVLYLFTDSQKFSFDSTVYHNYDSLKIDIITNSKRNTDYEENWKPKLIKKLFVALSIIGLVLLFFSYKNRTEIDQISNRKSYIEIEPKMISKVEIIKRRKKTRYINLNLKDFPEFEFRLYTITPELIRDLKKGDLVKCYILKEDYQKKLLKETELTFYDKYFGYYGIDVLGLTKNNTTYIKIDSSIKKEISNSNFNFWIQFYSGIILLLMGISGYAENQW